LKSGTAQKFVLNMISTITMVRLGKVYRNYMVDMRVANSKLAARAVRMLREITGADAEAAEAALAASGEHVKTAVVMLELGIEAPEARARLEAADGRLSGALGAA
jgi:N-acetylmuramic acid 6-phosphate etherase